MEHRVALLRGINVGGGGRLRMVDLRAAAVAVGFSEVTTHGASGNLLYASGNAAEHDAGLLREALASVMAKPPVVVVRSVEALQNLVDLDPFVGAPDGVPGKWRFVAFLESPTKAPLPPIPAGMGYAMQREGEVCFWMAEPHREAIDFPKHLGRAMGTMVTVRNWNVVQALAGSHVFQEGRGG